MNLIHQHIVETLPTSRVYRFFGWPQGMSDEKSEQYLESRVQMSMRVILVAQDTVVFIDDAQSSYYDNYLWILFKILDSGALFILFSSYGSPGPFPVQVETGTSPIFCEIKGFLCNGRATWRLKSQPGYYLPEMRLTTSLPDTAPTIKNRPQLSADLRNLLVNISGGHAGALAGLVETIVTDHASIPSLKKIIANSLYSS
jgi:hypothetical protein